jgi:hypothetical protein
MNKESYDAIPRLLSSMQFERRVVWGFLALSRRPFEVMCVTSSDRISGWGLLTAAGAEAIERRSGLAAPICSSRGSCLQVSLELESVH